MFAFDWSSVGNGHEQAWIFVANTVAIQQISTYQFWLVRLGTSSTNLNLWPGQPPQPSLHSCQNPVASWHWSSRPDPTTEFLSHHAQLKATRCWGCAASRWNENRSRRPKLKNWMSQPWIHFCGGLSNCMLVIKIWRWLPGNLPAGTYIAHLNAF